MLNMVKYSFEDVEFENKWEKDELSRTNVHVIELYLKRGILQSLLDIDIESSEFDGTKARLVNMVRVLLMGTILL